MDSHRWLVILWITIILSFQYSNNVEGRHHTSKKHKSKSPSSGSPAYAPSPDDSASESPDNPPPVPSDPSNPPSPPDTGNSTSINGCTFDVTSFGAVGDGNTDDTDAFRAAWKAACQVESALLLVPSGYQFMIYSTIFSGPCKPGLVFQVRQIFSLSSFFFHSVRFTDY